MTALLRTLDVTHSQNTRYAFFVSAIARLQRAHNIGLSTAAALLAADPTELPRLVNQILTFPLGQQPLLMDQRTDELSQAKPCS
jgi:hypothetical protein